MSINLDIAASIILNLEDFDDLCNLSLVQREWTTLAQSVLFNTVVITLATGDLPGESVSVARPWVRFWKLLKHAHIRPMIHRLEILRVQPDEINAERMALLGSLINVHTLGFTYARFDPTYLDAIPTVRALNLHLKNYGTMTLVNKPMDQRYRLQDVTLDITESWTFGHVAQWIALSLNQEMLRRIDVRLHNMTAYGETQLTTLKNLVLISSSAISYLKDLVVRIPAHVSEH